jgi:hypothetical protein
MGREGANRDDGYHQGADAHEGVAHPVPLPARPAWWLRAVSVTGTGVALPASGWRVRRLTLVRGLPGLRHILQFRREGRLARLLAVGLLLPVRLLPRRIVRLALTLTRVLLAERIPWRLLIAHDVPSPAAASSAPLPRFRRRTEGICRSRRV